MTNLTLHARTNDAVSKDERQRTNDFILAHLQTTMRDGHTALLDLEKRLRLTYNVIVGLSVVMFSVGIALIAAPVYAGLTGQEGVAKPLIAGGLGIADLTALYLFRPIDRIHALMGDMSQVTIALNAFQTQVGLRLLEMRADEAETVGAAAEDIRHASEVSIKLVEDYFETAASTPSVPEPEQPEPFDQSRPLPYS
jgi:hypothetical protein